MVEHGIEESGKEGGIDEAVFLVDAKKEWGGA